MKPQWENIRLQVCRAWASLVALLLLLLLLLSCSVVSDSMWPHRWQPTRLSCPWDSPGKNTGVGCHFLLQCMKVKSESEIAQSCPTQRPHGLQPTRLLHPWDFPDESTGVGCHCLLHPSSSAGNKSACSAGDPDSIPGLGRFPWRRDRLPTPVFLGFPVAQMVKNLSALRETWVDPWVGNIPWRREWLPTLVVLPGEFHMQRRLTGSIVRGVTKSQTWLSCFHS